MLEINIDVLRFPKPTSLLLAVDKQLLIANFTEPESKLSRPEQFLRDILKIERVRERLEALYVCSEIEEKKKQTEYVEMKCPVTSKLPLSLSLYIYIYISLSISLCFFLFYPSCFLVAIYLSLSLPRSFFEFWTSLFLNREINRDTDRYMITDKINYVLGLITFSLPILHSLLSQEHGRDRGCLLQGTQVR